MYEIELTDQDGHVHTHKTSIKSDIPLFIYKFTTETMNGDITVQIKLRQEESDGGE